MAYRLCPLSCITQNRSKKNCNLHSGGDDSSMVWDVLCPLVFCSDVFPPTSSRNKEPTDLSNTCWYCHVENNASGKFVTKKSNDPIPDEIRRVQEKLEFSPGEPLTKHSFHKIIPTWHYRSRRKHINESTSQAKSSTPCRVSSLNGLPTSKRKSEKSGDPPLKKYAEDRPGNTVPIAVSHRSSSGHKSVKPVLNSMSLASAS